MNEIALCPVCHSQNHEPIMACKDYTVSHSSFTVRHCNSCGLRFTSPVPGKSEIGPYYKSESYISHSNTKKGLMNQAYQVVRTLTLNSKKSWVQKGTNVNKGQLLDIGSGAGAFLATMKNSGWDVMGLEPDEDARQVAKKDFGVDSQNTDLLFQLQAERFDAVTMWHVLEHVHDISDYFSQIKTILKPKGCLFVAVPNYTSLDAKKYGSVWAAYDVPRHLYHFSPDSMRRLLQENGLKLLKIKRMPFDSFYVSLLSEQYRKGSFLRGLWIGFKSYANSLFNKERCSSLVYVIGK
jgi:2-polyprenyl-3-methyl-5-hydroxy-6-metoxy-1,4-benzoquinol methylase